MTNEIKAHIIAAFNLYVKVGEGSTRFSSIWNYVARRVEVDAEQITQWIDDCAADAGCTRLHGSPEFRNTFYVRV